MRNIFKLIVFVLMFLVSCKEKENIIGDIIESPALEGSMQPFLYAASGNELLMSWTQKIDSSSYALMYSELTKNKWISPVEITFGDNWFVNWADFPAIAKNNDNLLVHYLQKSDSAAYAYDVHLMSSSTDGDTWGNDFILHSDSTKTEHGFVSMLPYKDSFFVTWLDGRNTGGEGHEGGYHGNGAMTIRAAEVLSTGSVMNDVEIDKKTCDCCQTSAAITPKGPIVVYRNRTDDEVRDIYISRMLDGSWTIPKPIYNDEWIINGCPVNGPKAVTFNNTLVVAWFTAANKISKVNVAFSDDSGANFDLPIRIDNGKPIGRVDVILLDETNALVSWMESANNDAKLKVIKVDKDGNKQKSLVISALSASRKSGFPQLEKAGDKIYVAWNNIEGEKNTIKIKSIDPTIFN